MECIENPDGNGQHHPTTKLQQRFSVGIPSRQNGMKAESLSRMNWPSSPTDLKWSLVRVPVYTVSLETHFARLDLRTGCSVFQAEVAAIKQAADMIIEENISEKIISIYVDSQAAIKALQSTSIRSKLVKICKKRLDDISAANTVTLCWVPGHTDISGNEKADELAREGSFVNSLRALSEASILLSTLQREIEIEAIEEANKRWYRLDTCATAKSLWPVHDKKRSINLMELSRRDIRITAGVVTGHCVIGNHAARVIIGNHTTQRLL